MGARGAVPAARPQQLKGKIVETIDKQLESAFRLRDSLNDELSRAEIMSDRIPIREDLREVNEQISKLKIKQQLFWKNVFKNVEEGE